MPRWWRPISGRLEKPPVLLIRHRCRRQVHFIRRIEVLTGSRREPDHLAAVFKAQRPIVEPQGPRPPPAEVAAEPLKSHLLYGEALLAAVIHILCIALWQALPQALWSHDGMRRSNHVQTVRFREAAEAIERVLHPWAPPL